MSARPVDVRIYVASSLERVETARGLARMFVDAGLAIVSRWHDVVEPGDRDPDHQPTREQILAANLSDLQRADVVVAYVAGGTPRATYAETGYALAMAKPVVFITTPNGVGRCIFDGHPLATVCTSEFDAVAAVKAAERRAA